MGKSRKSGVPVSGLRIKRFSENKISRCMINNTAFSSDQTYYVLTTDYLAKGGEEMSFFKEAVQYINTGVLLRDAIINYIIEINKSDIKVEAKYDGRIHVVMDRRKFVKKTSLGLLALPLISNTTWSLRSENKEKK